MSWLDKITTGLTITCGDGKSYTPNWIVAQKGVEYNISTFEFKDVPGTLVYRGQPKGARYPLEVYFQGEDHLDVSDAFEASAANKSAWTISHPFYGSLYVQPADLYRDNIDQNITKISSLVIETINTTPDKPTVSAPDKITEDKDTTDAALAADLDKDVNLSTADKLSMKDSLAGMYNSVSGFITDNTDASDYLNAYNEANSYLNNSAFDTLELTKQVQAVVNMPAKFNTTIQRRLNMLALQMGQINAAIISTLPISQRKIYEATGGTILGAMILASVTNITNDYGSRKDVLSVIDTIISQYNTYISNLDLLQTAPGLGLLTYIPSPGGITALTNLLNYAVNNLFSVANNAKQERSLVLEENSNIILLANRLYGLKPDDSTIDYFMQTNNIGLNEVLQIQKGRKIVYYV